QLVVHRDSEELGTSDYLEGKANFCPRAMPPEAHRPAFHKSLPRRHLPSEDAQRGFAAHHTTGW
ncbi:hypothetical protein O3P69_015528, partial [Scylla paramamosain]